jgi:hypothetical protein
MSPNDAAIAAGQDTRVLYRKMPGDFRGFFRRNTLWLGGDHLLLVDSSRFSETYKRFYLRDIQSVVIRKTARLALPYYWVLLACVAIIVLLVGLRPFLPWLFWTSVVTLAGLTLYLYIASVFQSCACHLITRVNKVELPSLFRLGSANRFVDILTPRIITAQGQLPADWVERSTTLEELSTAADRNPEATVDLLPAGQFSWLPIVVFLLVLFDAALTTLQLRANNSSLLSTPNMLNLVALAVCATISIVRLSRQKGGRPLRMIVVAGLVEVAAITYASVMLQSFDQQLTHQTYKNVLQYPGMRPLAIVEVLLDAIVAIPGLILAFRQPRGTPKP